MSCSTRSHPELVPPTANPDEALHITHNPSFETTAKNGAITNSEISAWELELKDKRKQMAGEVPTAALEELDVEYNNCQSQKSLPSEDVIA